MLHNRPHSAFTLVELSIVLVILGLLVGGVLAGQSLIEAASLRKQIVQFQEVNVAANAFKVKYLTLPGDLQAPDRFNLWVPPTYAGDPGVGDGDGKVEQWGGNNAICVSRFSGELVLFWRHLAEAGLMEGQFTDDAEELGTVVPGPGISFPRGKLHSDSGILVSALPADCGTSTGATASAEGSKHYIITGAVSSVDTQRDAVYGSDWWTNTLGLTPTESYQIDAKMDDSKPLSGIVQARFAYSIHNILPAADNNWAIGCTVAGATSYDVSLAGRVCRLRIQTAF